MKMNFLAKKIIAAIAAGTLLIAVPMSGCDNKDDNKKENSSSESKVSQTAETEKVETKFGDEIVAKSQNYSIPFSVFQYLYNYNYQSFTGTYGTNMLDTTKSLTEQYYDETNKITWHDYFVQATQDYITYIMTFAEAAQDNGVVFTAADNQEIEDGFKSIEEIAQQNSQTLKEYFKSIYGDSITQDDIRNIQKLSKIGLKTRNKLNESYTFKDDEYEAKFNENKTAYQVADYYSFDFSFTELNEAQTSSVVNEDKKKKMKENADALANCKTAKEFNDYVTKFLKSNPDLVPMATQSGEESMTEESFNSLLDTYVGTLYHAKTAYNDSSDVAKWIFSDERKEGDTEVVEGDTSYSVIMVSKPLYRDEEATRNIRHILITTDSVKAEGDSEVTDEQVKAKAEEIYKSWKDGDATEEKFAELANQYSTDPGSNTNGGIYKNVTQGQMVPAFNDWMFDNNRKPGDSGIVKTDYGYHIMYYVGAGLKSWQINVDTALREEKLASDYEQMKTKYKVEFDETAVKNVVLDTSEEESTVSSSGAANLAE